MSRAPTRVDPRRQGRPADGRQDAPRLEAGELQGRRRRDSELGRSRSPPRHLQCRWRAAVACWRQTSASLPTRTEGPGGVDRRHACPLPRQSSALLARAHRRHVDERDQRFGHRVRRISHRRAISRVAAARSAGLTSAGILPVELGASPANPVRPLFAFWCARPQRCCKNAVSPDDSTPHGKQRR